MKSAKLFTPLLLASLGCFLISASTALADDQPFVSPEVEGAINAGKTVEMIVHFSGSPELTPAYRMSWKDRGRWVHETMTDASQASQADVRSQLRSLGTDFTPLNSFNMIVIRDADDTVLQALIADRSVRGIFAKPEFFLTGYEVEVEAGHRSAELNLDQIRASQVWSELGIRGEDVVVGLNDTSARYTHDALVDQYRGNEGGGNFNHNYNWYDPNTGQSAPFPEFHGTHVTGIMIGDDGNGNQIGVAPESDWIACGGCAGGACGGVLECLDWFTAPTDMGGNNPDPDRRPHLVNNSWGNCAQSHDAGLYNPIWDTLYAAGVIPFFSNGNNLACNYPAPPGLNTVGDPARSGRVLGIGSTTRTGGDYAFHSNWGPTDYGNEGLPESFDHFGYPDLKPNVSVPGQGIRSAAEGGDSAYTGGTGTSMAAPHATGVAALMISAAPCLAGDFQTIGTIMMGTAIHVEFDGAGAGDPDVEPGVNYPNYASGWGELDALAAVEAAIAACGDKGFVDGNVTSAAGGSPIEGVIVSIDNPNPPPDDWQTISDPGGDYLLEAGVTEGGQTYTVEFFRNGFLPTSVSGVEVAEDEFTTIDVEMQPAATFEVSGVITDANTDDFVAAEVSVVDEDGFSYGPVISDESTGEYLLDLPGNFEFTLTVTAEGYQSQAIEIGPLSGGVEVDVVLNAGVIELPGSAFLALPRGSEDSVTVEIGNTGSAEAEVVLLLVGDDGSDLPWADVDPSAVTVPEDDSVVVDLQINATALHAGTYELDLEVIAGSAYDIAPMPFILEVEAVPEIVIPELVEMEIVFGATGSETIEVENLGGADGEVTIDFGGGLILEQFEQAFPPQGWTVTDDSGGECTWMRTDQWPMENHAGGEGTGAGINSDACGVGISVDSSLISPQINLVGAQSASLSLIGAYHHLDNSFLSFDISDDGGETWTSEIEWNANVDPEGPGTEVNIDLADYLGSSEVHVRMRYSSGWDWWAVVDDVLVEASVTWAEASPSTFSVPAGGSTQTDIMVDSSALAGPGTYSAEFRASVDSPVPTPPGLLVATVVAGDDLGGLSGTVESQGYCNDSPFDAAGAEITVEGQIDTYTVIAEENGFYEIFLPIDESPVDVIVSAANHVSETQDDVALTPAGNVTADFDLLLDEPCIDVDPDSFVTELQPGDSVTEALDIQNLGAGELEWNLDTAEPTLVTANEGGNAGPGLGSVDDASFASDLITAAGGQPPRVEYAAPAGVFDCDDAPGLIIHDDGVIDNGYSGDPAVASEVALVEGFTPEGSGVLGTVCISLITLGQDTLDFELVVFDDDGSGGAPGTELAAVSATATDLPQGIPPEPAWYTIDLSGENIRVESGTIYIGARYVPEVEGVYVAADENGPGAGIGYFQTDGGGWLQLGTLVFPDYSALLIRPQIYYDPVDCDSLTDVSWLSIDPESGTTGPGGTSSVDIVIDSAGLAPGAYEAGICVYSNDTRQVPVGLPVSLTVDLTDDFSTLTGQVTSQGYCGEDPSVVADAQIEIVGEHNIYTVTADADGMYQIILNADESPVDITASLPAHLDGAVLDVQLSGGETHVVDFDLSRDAPCIEADPESFSIQLEPGDSVTEALSLHNHGAAPLEWNLEAVPAGDLNCDEVSEVSWLSVNPESGTAGPIDSSMVDVIIDSTGHVPGNYEASICVFSNDPEQDIVDIPVSLSVNLTEDFAALSGQITSQGYCDEDSSAGAGAVIEIVGEHDTYTATAGADGTYQITLDINESPVTVTATLSDHLDGVESDVQLTGGETSVVDFDLLLDRPCIDTDLDSILAELEAGDSVTETLTIHNLGAGELEWNLDTAEPAVVVTANEGGNAGPGVGSGNDASFTSDLFTATGGQPPLLEYVAPAGAFDCNDAPGLIIHDNGGIDNGYSASPDSVSEAALVEGFTPLEPGVLGTICISFLSLGPDSVDFELVVFDSDGPGGAPGTELAAVSATATDIPSGFPPEPVWYTVDLSGESILVESGTIYIGARYAPVAGLFIASDESGPGPGIAFFQTDGGPWNELGVGNVFPNYAALLIRPQLQSPTGCDDVSEINWLSLDPASGTTAPGGSSTVDVMIDSAGEEFGVYEASICIFSNDPKGMIAVPATLSVDPPDDFATLTGQVISQGYCSVDPNPAAGAEIEVIGSIGTYTTTADSNGLFSLFIDPNESPAEITASFPGYISQSEMGVEFGVQDDITVDFDLVLDAPCASVNPKSFDLVLADGEVEQVNLSIGNVGGGINLNWAIDLDSRSLDADLLADYGVLGHPATREVDPELDEVLAVGGFSVTGGADGGNVEVFEIASGIETRGDVIGFTFEGTVSSISDASDWGSDMQMTITSPAGDSFEVGGFTDVVNRWEFHGSGSGEDGTYISLHLEADDGTPVFSEDETPSPGDWTIEFTHGWNDDLAGTMDWSDVTITLHKATLPTCIAPADAPWLEVSATAGTTAPDGEETVIVTVDNSGLDASEHSAFLCIESDDPETPLIPLPVSVSAPTDEIFRNRFEQDVERAAK